MQARWQLGRLQVGAQESLKVEEKRISSRYVVTQATAPPIVAGAGEAHESSARRRGLVWLKACHTGLNYGDMYKYAIVVRWSTVELE